MSVNKAIVIFICAAVAAWLAAYAPGIWHRHRVFSALDESLPRWVCVINGDAVSSDYEGYVTRKYIMLGGQRFYSAEFKKWGRAADYMLVVIDDNQGINWMRLDIAETGYYAKRYGIARVGCRRMEPGRNATDLVAPITPPLHDGIYTGPSNVTATPGGSTGGTSFDWKNAVGPALGPSGNSAPASSSPAVPAPPEDER